MALQYRVRNLFAVDEQLYTNQPKDLAAIKELPRAVRDAQIALGNLVEWNDGQGDEAPAAAEAEAAQAAATPAKTTTTRSPKKGR